MLVLRRSAAYALAQSLSVTTCVLTIRNASGNLYNYELHNVSSEIVDVEPENRVVYIFRGWFNASSGDTVEEAIFYNGSDEVFREVNLSLVVSQSGENEFVERISFVYQP